MLDQFFKEVLTSYEVPHFFCGTGTAFLQNTAPHRHWDEKITFFQLMFSVQYCSALTTQVWIHLDIGGQGPSEKLKD